jgi:hypothetical protein
MYLKNVAVSDRLTVMHSLHQNLDPFEEYYDALLNDGFLAAGLFSMQGEIEEAGFTLASSAFRK